MPPAHSCARVNTTVLVPDGLKPERQPSTGAPSYVVSFTGFHAEDYNTSTHGGDAAKECRASTSPPHFDCTYAEYSAHVTAIGGRVLPSVTRKTTLLVAWRGLTHKRLTAERFNIPVVRPEWLVEAARGGAGSRPPNTGAYAVPKLYGYTFCTSGLTCEELRAFAHLLESNGGTVQATLTQWCDALFVSPENADMLCRQRRQGPEPRCQAPSSGAVAEDLTGVSAKVRFAWECGIPIMSYQRFLQLANLEVSFVPPTHKSDRLRGRGQVNAFDVIVELCAIPSVFQSTNDPLQVPAMTGVEYISEEDADESDGDMSVGSLSEEDGGLADAVETGMENYYTAQVPLSQYQRRTCTANEAEEMIQDAIPEPPLTLAVDTPDYFLSCPSEQLVGDENKGDLVRNYYRTHPADAARSMLKATSVKEAASTSRSEHVDATLADQPASEPGGLSPPAAVPLPTMMLHHHPPTISVCLLGFQGKERDAAVRMCVACRFMRTPVPTRETDIIILGNGAVKLKKKVTDHRRRRQLRGNPHTSSIATVTYYECTPELVRELRMHYGIGMHQIVAASWLRSCMKALEQTLRMDDVRSGRPTVAETATEEETAEGLLLTPSNERVTQRVSGGGAGFYPGMAIPVELLPGTQQRQYRVYARRWVEEEPSAPPSAAPPPLPPITANTRAGIVRYPTAPLVSAETAAPRTAQSTAAANETSASPANGAPPESTVLVKPSAHTGEQTQYQQERERATVLLDGFLRILSTATCNSPQADRESEETDYTQTLGDVADVFSDCLMCFVGGEFARTELAVVRGLIRVGRGTPLKKTIAQWCQALQKKPVNTLTDNGEQAELTEEERRAEVIRRHTILGKKMRQIFGDWMAAVDARRGPAGRQEAGVDWQPQTSAAAPLHTSKSELLSVEAFSMQDETSTQWMAPVPPADITNYNHPGAGGQQLRTKLHAISQICLAHPVLYVVPHHHQRCAQSDPTPAEETSREDTESRRRDRSPLRYLVTVTMDYILCSLAARRRLDPRACFLFTEPIPSPTDLLLRHPQTTKQSMTRSASFPETPGLSKWVWQRRYAKTQSVGVCVSFVWLLAAAGGPPGCSASSRSRVSRSQQAVLDVLPDTRLAPLLRALLLGFHSVVHALGGTVRDLFEPSAVTHVVVVDVEAIVRSSLQNLYNGGSTDSPSVDGDRVSWPQFAWEAALHHAGNDDVSLVNVTWLQDSLHWGQFVDEAKETYACPSGMLTEQPETAGGTRVVSVTGVRAELNQPNPKDGTPSDEDGADTTLRPVVPSAVYCSLERGVPMANAFDFAAPVTTPIVSRQKPGSETPLPASGATPRQLERLCTSPFHIRNSKLRAASQSSRCGGALLTVANGGSQPPSGQHSRTTITIEDQQHPSEGSEPDVAPIGKTGHCPSLGFVTNPPHFAPPVEASEPTKELSSPPPPPHTSTPIRAPPVEAIRCCHSTPVAPYQIPAPTISSNSNASMMPPLSLQKDDCSPLSPPPHPSLVTFDPGSKTAEQYEDLVSQRDSQSARLIPWNPSSPSLQPVPSQPFEGDDLTSPTQCSLLEFPPTPSPWHPQPPLRSSFEFLDSCDRTLPLPASPLAETVDHDDALATADAPEVRRMLLLSAVTSAGNSRHMPMVSPPQTQPLSQEATPRDVAARQAEATGVFSYLPPATTTETPTTGNQNRSSEEITQSTSGGPTSGHKRPRLSYTSVSPIPRLEDAVVVLDQSRENDPLARTPPTPESCAKYIGRSFVRNISLFKRATPPPAAPTSCIRALSSTDPQTEIAPAGSERHTPLRVYLQHDLPHRKGLLARLSEVVSQLQPSLLTPEDGKLSNCACSPRDDHFGPVEFVKACEHADCIVTHDLSPRESVLVAIAAGLWVLRPSFLVHMVERMEVERCAGEWWAGVQSSLMHRFLELHEWSREAMPWNAPQLHTELAKQCMLRRKQWQQHGQRVFDQIVFVLCFGGDASCPLPAPNERQEVSSIPTAVPSLGKNSSAKPVDSNLVVQHGEQQAPACQPTPEPVAAGCELQPTDAAANMPYPLNKKISAIQRLIKAGGGEVGDILRLEGLPASPTDAPADRERCPRWFHSTHAPFSEDTVKGNPTDLDSAHEAEVDPFLKVMAQVLCKVLVTHGTSPVVTSGGVEIQCPPQSKPRELVVLLDSTLQTELPATTTDPSAQPVPHSVQSWWLELMFAASHRGLAQRNQLATCLQRAHLELSKQDRTASAKVGGPAPRNDRFLNRVRSTSLPVPALNLIVDTKRQPHPTSPTNMSTCPLTHTVITALQHAASISHPVGWVAADMSQVARVSVKSMSWLARYIAGQSGLDNDPSISLGALEFL